MNEEELANARESDPIIRFSFDNNVIEFEDIPSAEHAAWVLRGQCINGTQVRLPDCNVNPETIDTVGFKWRWVVEDDELRDDLFFTEESEEEDLSKQREILSQQIENIAEQINSMNLGFKLALVQAPQVEPLNEKLQNFKQLLDEGHNNLQLRGINLSNRTLVGLPFDRADLSDANFEGAVLINCSFRQTILSRASFKNAQMAGTVLSSAWLSEANFEGADLSVARLDWVNLEEGKLCNADLSGACLESANLSYTNFSHADLSNGKLLGAKLTNATCIGTQFQNAELTDVNLEFANLSKADFEGAKLGLASLAGTTGFDPKKHRGVRYDCTCMPDGRLRGSITARKLKFPFVVILGILLGYGLFGAICQRNPTKRFDAPQTVKPH